MISARRLVLAAAALASVAFGAGAQRPSAPALTAADLPVQLAPATRQAIARLGDSLRAVRLPDEPLYAKAAEGVLKGAEDARIIVAVRALARELGEARAALGAAADDADLVAAASALHVGATPAMLTRLQDTHRAATNGATSLATPLVALADLLTRRVPAPAAAAAIDSLVARRAPAGDFAALRAAVERDIDAGRAPEASVLQRTQVLLRGLDSRRTP
ncbi:MAG TPA: hypothetical protein VH539_04815 [Gemmatimonadaceae bacterium]|jgi:hypothetical protein